MPTKTAKKRAAKPKAAKKPAKKTEESADLGALLTEGHELASATLAAAEEADEMFDELSDVEEDPEAALALAEEDEVDEDEDEEVEEISSVEAVERAMEALGDDALSHAERPEVEESGPISAERLQPVPRPGGDAYKPRVIGARTDVEMLREARAASLPVLLAGYPGCGKTALVEATYGEELLTVGGHGDTEVADLIGTYTQKPDGRYEWTNGPLVIAMREGRPLFVDDITLIPSTVLARLYPAMDGRGKIVVTEHEGEEVIAQEGFYVCGAHNPDAPGAVLAEALASRFLIHMNVETDLRLAMDMGIDAKIVGATAALQTDRAKGVITWAPEMRELLGFKRTAEALGTSIAVNALVGIAPEDARDAVAAKLKTWYPTAEPLRLKGSNVGV